MRGGRVWGWLVWALVDFEAGWWVVVLDLFFIGLGWFGWGLNVEL